MKNLSGELHNSSARIARRPSRRSFLPQTRKAAFTVIELTAIIAMLALMACVLAPALSRTAPNSVQFQCLNNLRQLGAAWMMYADDNHGKLVYNRDGGAAGATSADAAWVAGYLDFTTSTANTNTAMLVDHNRYPYGAYLGPYLKTPRPFKCPADISAVTIAGQSLPRVRSVSMNNYVGQGGRLWEGSSRYRRYNKMDDIYGPSPSQLFVFVEEQENSINDGCFMTDPDTLYQLVDYPASRHNSGGAFGFADGHSEIHAWHDPRTTPPFVPGQLLYLNVNLPGDVDALWLAQHCAGR